MTILATYTDTNQRTYNIVDNLQDGDYIKYSHVYTAIGQHGNTFRIECGKLPCEECIYSNVQCAGTQDILQNPEFDTYFPGFRESNPEFFI